MIADSLALLSYVNTDLEQNWCDHIAYCLESRQSIQCIEKNVPDHLKFLFDDYLPKTIMLL